jgi:inorganic pyrophosphatase
MPVVSERVSGTQTLDLDVKRNLDVKSSRCRQSSPKINFGNIFRFARFALTAWRTAVDLTRIPAQPKPGLINVLVEIIAGSKNKYEFDKDLNAFALDRVMFSSVQYPYDYGFVPNTLADDGDPLDGMVMMDEPTFPGCVIAARPIGMMEMIDGGDRDEKILCVPDKDPRYAQIKSIKDLPQHRLDEIAEFFGTYKNLEKKPVEILGWKDVDAVFPLVEKCIQAALKG